MIKNRIKLEFKNGREINFKGRRYKLCGGYF